MGWLTTHVFSFTTGADAHRTWSVLTSSEETSRYLYGVSLTSDWLPGSAVHWAAPGGFEARGEVLAVDAPHRLVYSLDGGHGPATYLTWEVSDCPTGSTVRLLVDELDGVVDEDPEAVWMPIIAGLEASLAEDQQPHDEKG